VQITTAEDFGVQDRGGFYDQTGTIRDVVQNHLFQVMANLAMEPPVRSDSESMRDEKVKVLKAIPPLEVKKLVRSQFAGYLKEKGVAPNSQTETFAALRLDIDSWRWKGVPFYIRAGKCLPVTCTEVTARLRKPPTMFEGYKLTSNYVRLRISPEVVFAFGLMSICDGEENIGRSLESIASRNKCPTEMDAYERLLSDAMTGDATHFAREDYVEEAWRIVDPVLKEGTPISDYEPGTWGPAEAESRVCPPGGWQNPVIAAD
jgi:glucose-6-phosphate 1-dehydrogenase